MLRNVLLVAVGVASLALPPLASAEVSYTPRTGNKQPVITVAGQIKREDLNDFLAFTRSLRQARFWYSVTLDSTGGDVETALAMGRILRHDGAPAMVPINGRCLSSCVFVLAGAPYRYVDGIVGIHRPYFSADDATTATAQQLLYERLEKEVKAFLQAVNIPQDLYDHMLRIPPDKVKVLSPDDLQRYGLSEPDPYADAAGNAAMAQELGISSQEWIRRKAKATAECIFGNDDEILSCYSRIYRQGR